MKHIMSWGRSLILGLESESSFFRARVGVWSLTFLIPESESRKNKDSTSLTATAMTLQTWTSDTRFDIQIFSHWIAIFYK